jgi:hypothetical protein
MSKEIDMNLIEPYLLTKAPNGLKMYKYLHIDGGSGHRKRGLGGRYFFTAYYMDEFDHEEMGKVAAESFCKDKGIPFGHGNTVAEAIESLQLAIHTKQ